MTQENGKLITDMNAIFKNQATSNNGLVMTTNQFEEIKKSEQDFSELDREFDKEFIQNLDKTFTNKDGFYQHGENFKTFLHTSITKALREQAEQILKEMPTGCLSGCKEVVKKYRYERKNI